MHAMTPTVPSIKAYVSRKQRPMIIRSGLPNTVHDLSPVTQQSTTVGDQSVENDFATRSSSSHSDLSKLLSLLPRKPQRQQTCTGPNPEDSEEGEDCSEDHARLVRKRKPTLKRIDEASHLHRDERQVIIYLPNDDPNHHFFDPLNPTGIREEARRPTGSLRANRCISTSYRRCLVDLVFLKTTL